jgi:hypothetical protein
VRRNGQYSIEHAQGMVPKLKNQSKVLITWIGLKENVLVEKTITIWCSASEMRSVM